MSQDPKHVPGDIEQIRDLIFGQQMTDYQMRFQELKQLLNDLQTDMTRRYNNLQQSIESALGESRENNADLEKRIGLSESNLKQLLKEVELRFSDALEQLREDGAGREELGKYLVQLGERLKKPDDATQKNGHIQVGDND